MIEEFDCRSFTWEAAKEFALIQSDAFRNDDVTNAYIPENERFNDHVLPPIADYKALRQRCDLFEKTVNAAARETFLAVRTNPRSRIFLYKEPQLGYVAGAFWVLPKYIELPPLPMHIRIKNYLLQKWFAIKNYLSFFWVKNPFVAYNVREFFVESANRLGGRCTEERLGQLHAMDSGRLEKTHYPQDLSYYLRILVVRSNMAKRGYGQKILRQSLDRMRPFKSPPTFSGPAKLGLISAPTARGFYNSIGLSQGASIERVLPNKEPTTSVYYFSNLD